MKRDARSVLLTLLIVPALLLVGSSQATATTFLLTAVINGAQEVPPRASTATGFATFLLNDAVPSMTYNVTINGLDFTGSQTADPLDNLLNAHIHAPGAPGVNASVVFGFFGSPFNETNPNDVVVTPFAIGVGGTITGKWDAPEGNGTTLTAQLANILAGNAYINFHTTQFTGGEIRGQITPVPEPGTLTLLGLGVSCLAGRFRRRRTVSS